MEFWKWRFCDKESIRKIVGNNNTNMKTLVIPDVGRTNYKEDSVIDMVRVAKNIIINALKDIGESGTDRIYIIENYGTLIA